MVKRGMKTTVPAWLPLAILAVMTRSVPLYHQPGAISQASGSVNVAKQHDGRARLEAQLVRWEPCGREAVQELGGV
jgi:hypothetical protein